MESPLQALRVSRKAVKVFPLKVDADDKAFWLSKTPDERLEAVELMRQINYGYNTISARLQRVLEVVELKKS